MNHDTEEENERGNWRQNTWVYALKERNQMRCGRGMGREWMVKMFVHTPMPQLLMHYGDRDKKTEDGTLIEEGGIDLVCEFCLLCLLLLPHLLSTDRNEKRLAFRVACERVCARSGGREVVCVYSGDAKVCVCCVCLFAVSKTR